MLDLNLLFVIILLGGWLFGKIAEKLRLPAVLGMVILGILCSSFLKPHTPAVLWEVSGFLKSAALIIILLRAGLGIRRSTLKKAGLTAMLMSCVPCMIEGTSLLFLFHWIFSFDYVSAGITAFLLAAVSPAVVVPTMLEFKERGLGRENEVPTVILAGASVDDVFCITLFSVFIGLATTGEVNLLKAALGVPVSILVGIVSGIIAGFLLAHFFHKNHDRIRASEKSLILLTCAAFLVSVGDQLHFAALLGIMTTGFIILERAEPVALELARKFGKLWIPAQIILFVLIGFSVDLDTALSAGGRGLLIIIIGLFFRSIGVWIATAFSGFSRRERLLCVISYWPKATVQAALGGVALSKGLPHGETILAIAVLSIIFTAPLGLLAIRLLGERLLGHEV